MRPKKPWADPNHEGQVKGNQPVRTCAKCGNTVRQTRILKSLNLCEYCVNELREKRDGITSCRGCGKIEPLELKAHNGYCTQCVCSACGKPDPNYVRKTGLCFQCAQNLGDFCRRCGKEAAAQVRKNKGYCDECAVAKPTRRSTGYRGKHPDGRETKIGNHSGQNGAIVGRKTRNDNHKPNTGTKRPIHTKYQDQSQTTFGKATKATNDSKYSKPSAKRTRPFIASSSNNRERTESPGRFR